MKIGAVGLQVLLTGIMGSGGGGQTPKESVDDLSSAVKELREVGEGRKT